MELYLDKTVNIELELNKSFTQIEFKLYDNKSKNSWIGLEIALGDCVRDNTDNVIEDNEELVELVKKIIFKNAVYKELVEKKMKS